MKNRKPMGDHEKKHREERGMEQGAEVEMENEGTPPREERHATPGRGLGSEPPRPVTPKELGVPSGAHC